MTFPARPAALAAIALVLGGCSGGDTSGDRKATPEETRTTTAPKVAAANGPEIKADDFSFTVPEGWTEDNDLADDTEVVTFAYDTNDTNDDFADNINVTVGGESVGKLDDIEAAAVKQYEGAGFENVSVANRQEMDGETGIHLSTATSADGTPYLVEQYIVNHGGIGYYVTLSFSPDVPKPLREERSISILSTWKWLT